MATLRLDLHTHLKCARRVAFDVCRMSQYARALRSRGLNGLAIAEHIHGADYWAMCDALKRRYPYREGRFEVEDALFFPGFELTLAEGVDALALGPIEAMRRLDASFAHPASAGYHPTGAELADALNALESEIVCVAAHPARDDKHIDRLCLSVRSRLFHAVEINACHADADQIAAVKARAARKGWAITGGSDAHTWPQLGACWTEVEARGDAFDDLREAILAGRCGPAIHPQRERLVRIGRRLKAHIKRRSPKIERLPWRTSQGVLTIGAPAAADRLFEPALA